MVTDQVTFQENDGFSLHRNLYHDYDDDDDDDNDDDDDDDDDDIKDDADCLVPDILVASCL